MARDRERNTRAKTDGVIKNDMTNTGKYMEKARDEAGTNKAALTSTKVKVHRIASKLNRIRERSKVADANHRDTINRDRATAGRERDES